MPDTNELILLYNIRKPRIQSRLNEFSQIINSPNEKIFEELCFCILTANSSAKSGLRAIESIRPVLLKGSREDIAQKLKVSNYRFPNKRAEYIFNTRELLKSTINFNIKEKILSFNNKDSLRDYLVQNVKGFGYKETSHFLRNIGLKGYCILDKHIINTLCEFGVIETSKTPKNKKQYLELESKMIDFSKSLKIDLDELDLLLWSRKTGEILK